MGNGNCETGNGNRELETEKLKAGIRKREIENVTLNMANGK